MENNIDELIKNLTDEEIEDISTKVLINPETGVSYAVEAYCEKIKNPDKVSASNQGGKKI